MDMNEKTSFAWLSRQRPRSRDLTSLSPQTPSLAVKKQKNTRPPTARRAAEQNLIRDTQESFFEIDLLKLLG